MSHVVPKSNAMTTSTSFYQAFMPHGMCYQWRPDILSLHVASDILIAIAYFSIPIALYYFLKRRKDVPFRGVIYMFTVFIFACGVTHLISVWVVWNGHYGIQGIFKLLTALASIATALMMYPAMPKLLALRSPQELEKVNDDLQHEIVNRKHQEEQTIQLQTELAHIGRVSTMGQMATGLAHELNQPLLVISQSANAASHIAKKDHHTDEELLDCLNDIEAETQRAGEIIRALRQLVSKESGQTELIDINELSVQVLKMVKPDAREHNIDLIAPTCKDAITEANRVQIAQIIINLLRNSIQSISNSDNNEGKIAMMIERTKNTISVSIEDNGPGIIPEVELFKPFETIKSDGMGLGLSISKSIIESHGGSISAENIEGSGARFTFTLPVI